MSCNDELKDSNNGSPLPFPMFRRGLVPLQQIKCFRCVVKLSQSVALVGDQLQK